MAKALLNAVLAGEYQQGARVFAALKRPTARDFRWGGVCQLHLGDVLNARRLLLTAVAKGDGAARVDLATCLRFEGDFAGARAQLTGLDVDTLAPRDAALALREAAILEQQCGEISRAASLLDEAWSHAVAADPCVQSAVALSIALVAAHQGNDLRAGAYLQFAQEHASPTRQVYVWLARAGSATCLGQFEDAQRFLSTAEEHATSCPLSSSLLAYRWGMWFCAQGRWEGAREALGRAVQLAHDQQQPETEFYAQLGLAALATATGDGPAERGSLARAQALVKTPRAQAYLDWRLGAALARQADPSGLERLNVALEYFQATGCAREAIWVLLHLADAHARLGSPMAAREALRAAADAHVGIGGQQQLALELNGLTHARQLLGALAEHEYERVLCGPTSRAVPVAEVTLLTLGSPAILVDGQRVRLQMKKFVEVLAFLLRHGASTLMTLQMEVFRGVPLARSKNYIHQVRSELKRLVPGLSVPYDPVTHTYRVQCEGVQLSWDWQGLRETLLSSERAVMLTADCKVKDFLRDSDSEWVETEREHMSRWIVRVGLETMDAWYRAGEYAHCVKLAERLIEIEPLDEGLHDFLIRATVQVSGAGAARAVCWESQTLFAREVGHVPPLLEALAQQLQPN